MAWLSGWSYAKEISLTGQAGAGTLYQVELDIGASAGGDFHLEGNCTNFPQDIEVTDNDGTTLLDFSIEDITADPLKMWVEVADDLGSNQKIWVYYGKSGATTNSNGSATFLSFFNGSSTGWTEVDPNSHISFANNRLEFAGLTRGEDAYVYQANANVNGDVKIENTFRISAFASTGLVTTSILGDMVDDYANLDNCICSTVVYSTPSAYNARRINDVAASGAPTVSISTGTQYWTTTTIDRSGNVETKIYSDASRTTQVGATSVLDVSGVGATLDNVYLINSYNDVHSDRTITGWIDDFKIGKYNSPEPVFASAGAEQSAPTVGHPTMRRWGGIPGMQYTGRRSW